MPFAMSFECRCCQKAARVGDMWHCEDCWNKFHHGLRDHDWIDEATFRKSHPCNAEIMQMMQDLRDAKEYMAKDKNAIQRMIDATRKKSRSVALVTPLGVIPCQ